MAIRARTPAAESGLRKVNRAVTYWSATTRKPRPAVITAFSTNGGVVLRVGHTGITYGDVTTGITRKVNRTDTNVWSV